jgi:hypothetical protein
MGAGMEKEITESAAVLEVSKSCFKRTGQTSFFPLLKKGRIIINKEEDAYEQEEICNDTSV